jgi:putative membrane protein insertion efficiency factor
MKNIQPPTLNIRLPMGLRFSHRWIATAGGWVLEVPKLSLILAVRVYQLTVSPAQTFLFGATGGCRYTPSCSAYGLEALREHGAAAGTVLAAKRICRCHPWGGCGHDPVPPKNPRAETQGRKFI